MQVFVQNKVVDVALGADQALQAPLALRLMSRFPLLRRIPARLVGMGVRPEHVHSPDARAAENGPQAVSPRSLPA
jgi:hypothetical protein